MAIGQVLAAIVQGLARDVFDVFRGLVSKGASRTNVAVRDFRQMINSPIKVDDLGNYCAVVA